MCRVDVAESDDGNDEVPLSVLFGRCPSAIRRTLTASSKTARRSPNPRIAAQSPSHAGQVRLGDLVWAKALSSNTWWPGSVSRIVGSSALISFFGFDYGNRRKRVCLSQVQRFEDEYPRIMLYASARLAHAVDLALDELARRVADGLMLCCLRLPAQELSMELERFRPRDLVGFVRGLAVAPWVDDKEVPLVVTLSAQLCAFRRYVLLCQTARGKASHSLEPLKLLELARAAAVFSPQFCNSKRADFNAAVQELGEFRKMVSVCTTWRYRKELDFGDESSGEEAEDMPELETEEVSVISKVKDGKTFRLLSAEDADFVEEVDCSHRDFHPHLLAANYDGNQQKVINGGLVCTLNTEDFADIYMNEEAAAAPFKPQNECVLYKQDHSDVYTDMEVSTLNCGLMVKEMNNLFMVQDVCSNKRPVLQNSSYNESSLQPSFDAAPSVVFCNDTPSDSSHEQGISRVEETARVGVVPTDPDNLVKDEALMVEVDITAESRNFVLNEDVLVSNGETEMLEVNDCASTFSNSEVEVGMEQQLVMHLTECGLQTTTNVATDATVASALAQSGNDADVGNIGRSVPCLTDPVKDPSIQVSKKTRHDPLQSFFQLHDSLVRYPEAVSYAMMFAEYQNAHCELAAEDDSYSEFLSKSNADNIRKSQSQDRDLIVHNDGRVKNRKQSKPHDVSHPTNRCTKPVSHTVLSFAKWNQMQSSGLMAESTKSTSTRSKRCSVDGASHHRHPRTLHIKFPKDFTLPTNEELVQKFAEFGKLDLANTKVFFYTGSAQVVFIYEADAYAAYMYACKRDLFDQVKVRIWLDHNDSRTRVDGLANVTLESGNSMKIADASCDNVQKENYGISKKLDNYGRAVVRNGHFDGHGEQMKINNQYGVHENFQKENHGNSSKVDNHSKTMLRGRQLDSHIKQTKLDNCRKEMHCSGSLHASKEQLQLGHDALTDRTCLTNHRVGFAVNAVESMVKQSSAVPKPCLKRPADCSRTDQRRVRFLMETSS